MSQSDSNSTETKSLPLQWFMFLSLKKEFERQQTESELYLESQISDTNSTYINSKDRENLSFLKNVAPFLAGAVSAALSAGVLALHYKETDKYYLKQAQERQAMMESNPKLQNLFEAKGVNGPEFPFKKVSISQQRVRLFLCAGFFFAGAYVKAMATYRANLQSMDSLYYKAMYENMQKAQGIIANQQKGQN